MRAEEIGLRNVAGGCRLRAKVRPGGRADAIGAPLGGALRITVTAPPDRGRANAAVCALLARHFRVPPSRVSVSLGHASPSKTIHIEGLSADEVLARLSIAPP
jgi:hypothetical protein